LSEKLRIAEEREAALMAELSEIREQNEILEFRVLELEETAARRENLDGTTDSGIGSPEPSQVSEVRILRMELLNPREIQLFTFRDLRMNIN